MNTQSRFTALHACRHRTQYNAFTGHTFTSDAVLGAKRECLKVVCPACQLAINAQAKESPDVH